MNHDGRKIEELQHRFRSKNIEVVVWAKAGETGPAYEFTVQRRIKDAKTGEWTTSPHLSPHEGLIAAHLLHKAFDYSMQRTPSDHDPA